jgi:hypothetical protein
MTELVKTLDFELYVESGDTGVLDDATIKSRTAYSKTVKYYFNTNKSYDTIREESQDEVTLTENIVQLIADNAYKSIQNYCDNSCW